MHTLELIGYPLFLVAGLELLLGFILIKQNPHNSVINKNVAALAFISSAFALNTGIMYLRGAQGLDFMFFARLNWIGWLTMPPGLQFLYYIKDETSRAARVIGYVFYPFWAFVVVLCLTTDLIVTDSYSLLPFANAPGPLEPPLRIFASLFALFIVVQLFRVRGQSHGLIKKELGLYFAGMFIFSFGGGLSSGILQVAGGFGFEPGLGSYFSLPWVLLSFYAIVRYRLFDARIVLSRFLTTVTLVLLFSTFQALLFLFLEPSLGPVLTIFVTLPLLGVFLFGTTLSSRVRSYVDSVVVRDAYDYQKLLKDATTAMATILNLDELLRHIVEGTTRSLGVRSAWLYLAGPDGGLVARHGFGPQKGDLESRRLADIAVQWIRERRRTVLAEQLSSLFPDERAGSLLTYLRGIGAEILIPIFFQDDLRGVLLLGPKADRRRYSASDMLLLETLADHAAIAIENASLFDEAARVKASLAESEEKFRTLAQTIPAAIFIHQGGTFLYANPAAERLTGYSLSEGQNVNFTDVVHPLFRDLVRDRAVRRMMGDSVPQQYEFKIVRKSGEERWVIMSAGTMEYQGKPSVIGTLFDITDRKNLEGRMNYMKKMEAIGRLAAGVAHDFNNILTTALGNSSLIQAGLRPDDALQQPVGRILAALDRAGALTQRLLTYGTKQERQRTRFDLNDFAARQERFLAGLLPKTVALAIRPGGGALPVTADAGQLERCIMNLVTNARDAMPEGGTLTVETGAVTLESDFIRTHGFGQPGRYAFLSVRDTGTGMTEAVRRKIFEPFFTTKAEGKGTGFGLSVVYDIIKDHNGYVTADSEPDKGSCFTLYLPLVSDVYRTEEFAAAGPRAAGGETILLVDDDDAARVYARTILEEAEYQVIEAADGDEAVLRYREQSGRIGLVITDIIMPKKNGREVFGEIRKLRRDAAFLFISGYGEDIMRTTGFLEPGQPFLIKPLTQRDLLRKIAEVLERQRGGAAPKRE